MRLWSLHPKYLDCKGLCGLWREGLLAQNVLLGKTKAYLNHPQLNRFKTSINPSLSIAQYLWFVYEESLRRNYKFDSNKIKETNECYYLNVTQGQLIYEFNHLQDKLFVRDKQKMLENFELIKEHKTDLILAHPLFKVVEGDLEKWEKVK